MSRIQRMEAENARNQLADLLDVAENGRSTIITKNGRPVAAIVPVDSLAEQDVQQSLLPLKGSGRGLWGKSGALRDEWNR